MATALPRPLQCPGSTGSRAGSAAYSWGESEQVWPRQGRKKPTHAPCGALAFFPTTTTDETSLVAWAYGNNVRLFRFAKSGAEGATCIVHVICPSVRPPRILDDETKAHLEEDSLRACAWVDQHRLAVAGRLGIIWIFDVREKVQLLQALTGHLAPINCLCSRPTKRHIIISASSDCSLRMWDTSSGKCIAIISGVLQGHRDPVFTCSFEPTGHPVVATGGVEGIPFIWNFSHIDEEIIWHPKVLRIPDWSGTGAHRHWIEGLHWWGSAIISKARGESPKMWILTKGQTSEIVKIEYTVGDHFDVVQSQVHTLRFFEGLPDHADTASRTAVDYSRGYLAVACSAVDPCGIYIWHIESGELVAELTTKQSAQTFITSLSFSPDGSLLLAATNQGQLFQWTPRSRPQQPFKRGQQRGSWSTLAQQKECHHGEMPEQ